MNEMRKILCELTPEKRAEMVKRREDGIKSLTAEYQFGYYVGEYIFFRFLPTISIDSIHTLRVIPVLPEEEVKFDELNNIWFDKGQKEENSDAEWEQLMAYRREIEEKYLPHELVCHLDPLNITNEAEFKAGLRSSLWNCDICHYSIESEDITIEMDVDFYFTIIKLKLASLKK
jgi:hypothetical protein